jgi:hypothetical protein
MPLTLKYKHINTPSFVEALAKLGRYDRLKDFKLAYNIAKIIRRFDAESTIAQELFVKLVRQHCKLDENGLIIPADGKPGSFEILEGKETEWVQARKDFDEMEFELDCHKIRVEQLDGAPLSPMELVALEPLLIEMEAVPAPTSETAATA